jgi:succinate dehydrogenase/fumarate reductase-like Fe-S protein
MKEMSIIREEGKNKRSNEEGRRQKRRRYKWMKERSTCVLCGASQYVSLLEIVLWINSQTPATK